MARPVSVDEDLLLDRLSRAFREVGFEGASVSKLASAAGLQKASLYHRFPGGKEQMARDVLTAAETWLHAQVIAVLESDGPPAARIARVADALERFYSGGRQSCLVNVLAADFGRSGPFSEQVRRLVEALIAAIAHTLRATGLAKAEAGLRAEQILCELQGSLVLARALGHTAPFDHFLARLRNGSA